MRYAVLIALIACGGIDESKADTAAPLRSLPVAPIVSPPPPAPTVAPLPALSIADCGPLLPRASELRFFTQSVPGADNVPHCLGRCPNDQGNLLIEGRIDSAAAQNALASKWLQLCP